MKVQIKNNGEVIGEFEPNDNTFIDITGKDSVSYKHATLTTYMLDLEDGNRLRMYNANQVDAMLKDAGIIK